MAGPGPTTKPGQAQAEISPLNVSCTNTCLSNLYHILHGCPTSCLNTTLNTQFYSIVTFMAIVQRQSSQSTWLCVDVC
jgi:hypothetical protein